MPSKPALAAAGEIAKTIGDVHSDTGIDDSICLSMAKEPTPPDPYEGKLDGPNDPIVISVGDLATIIDAHFAPYLAAVEALRQISEWSDHLPIADNLKAIKEHGRVNKLALDALAKIPANT